MSEHSESIITKIASETGIVEGPLNPDHVRLVLDALRMAWSMAYEFGYDVGEDIGWTEGFNEGREEELA